MPPCDQVKCDVLILSANYGAGHQQVSKALSKRLKQLRPSWEIEILDFFSHVDPVFNQVLHFSYLQLLKHFSLGWQWFYESTKQLKPDSRWQRFLNAIGRQKLLDTIKQLSPRVIVCTFPTPAGVVSNLKSRGKINIPLVTVITDVAVHSQWIHPYVDAYIVGAEMVASSLCERGIAPQRIHVTGIPLRNSFESTVYDPSILERYELDPDRFTLMVMGGGDGLLSGIDNVCQQVGNLPLPLQILAVTGNNKTLAKKIMEISETSRNPIRTLEYVENIAELMEISHLLLTKAGGVTCFEALAKKLPLLLYKPLPGHEMSNMEFLVSQNAAVMADNEKEAVEKIQMLIEHPHILKGMVESIKPLSKPYATRDAVNIILQAAESTKKRPSLPNSPEEDSGGHLYA